MHPIKHYFKEMAQCLSKSFSKKIFFVYEKTDGEFILKSGFFRELLMFKNYRNKNHISLNVLKFGNLATYQLSTNNWFLDEGEAKDHLNDCILSKKIIPKNNFDSTFFEIERFLNNIVWVIERGDRKNPDGSYNYKIKKHKIKGIILCGGDVYIDTYKPKFNNNLNRKPLINVFFSKECAREFIVNEKIKSTNRLIDRIQS